MNGEEEFRKGMELLQSNEPWNFRKALEHFCEAADKGHVEATFEIGRMYLNGMPPQIAQNVLKAVKCFKISADEGLVEAKYYLALCYFWGKGVEKDLQKAITLFEENYRYGEPQSAHMLSFIYQEGIGVKADRQKALECNACARQARIVGAEIQYLNILRGNETINSEERNDF